jgi:hypothetical protein
MENQVMNLDTLAGLVQDRGYRALIEMTGGGCATLIAYDAEGLPLIAAGPGWFDGPNWTEGRANWDDFAWGPNDSENDYTYETEARDLSALADEIVALAERVSSERVANA